MLWALVGIRLLVPVSIESDFSLIPEFSVKYSETHFFEESEFTEKLEGSSKQDFELNSKEENESNHK